MNPKAGIIAELDVPGPGDVIIRELGFTGRSVSSPSDKWRLAVETEAGASGSVRWALIHDTSVRKTGDAVTVEISAKAVADDGTFVLARRTGSAETTIEIRLNDGHEIFSLRVEALATSCAISESSGWVAVGFIQAKRRDDPIILIDADRRKLYQRIPTQGGDIRSIDEGRRVISTEDGEVSFDQGRARSTAAEPAGSTRKAVAPRSAWRTVRTGFAVCLGIVATLFVAFILLQVVTSFFMPHKPRTPSLGFGGKVPEHREETRIPHPKSLADARQQRRALERLPPDGRFLRALEDLSMLAGASEPSHVTCAWADGKWALSLDGKLLGNLPETADFPMLHGILIGRAKTIAPAPEKGDAPPASPMLFDEALQKEEDAVNLAWAAPKHAKALLARAAHASVSEAVQMADDAGVGDAVPARAWALLALARAGGAGMDEDEVLLADSLGYTKFSHQHAAQLPESDPIRLYILRDDIALRLRADDPKADRATLYLWLRRLADLGDSIETKAITSRVEADRSQAMAAALARPLTLGACAEWAVPSAMLELANLSHDPEPPDPEQLTGRVLRTFEDRLRKLPPRGPVPFDTDFQKAGSRARFYTALNRALETGFMRGSRAEEDESLAWMGTAPGRFPSQVLLWLKAGIGRDDARDTNGRVWNGWPDLGEAASYWILDRAYSDGRAGSPYQREGLTMLMQRIDARPEHLAELTAITYGWGGDGTAGVRFGKRLLEVADRPWTAAWNLRWQGDESGFRRMIDDASVPARDREAAVNRLYEDHELSEDEAITRRSAIAARSNDFKLWQDYATWLRNHDRWSDMLSVLRPWEAAHEDDQTVENGTVHADFARALWMTGDAHEACDVMSKAVAGGSTRVLYEDGLAQLAAGHRAVAVRRAEEILEAYDGFASSNRLAAGIYWRMGDSEKAAKAMADVKWGSWIMEEDVARTFAQCFPKGLTAESRPALDALLNVLQPALHAPLAMGLARHKAFDLAEAIIDRLPDVDPAQEIKAYDGLKLARGQDAALAWFTKRDHAAAAIALIQAAYLNADDELLFSIPLPTEQSQASLAWMLRTASLVRRELTKGPEFDQVLRHYGGAHPDEKADWSQPAGRFLLGLEKSPAETHPETGPTALMGYAFLEGVKAEGRGDLTEAAECYLDSVGFAPVDAPLESNLASMRLHQWHEEMLPLGRKAPAR
jgi:hypothetical protein